MNKRVMLCGAGGFGETYVRQLAALHDQGAAEWVAVVDPYAKQSGRYADILQRNIPVFDTIDAFGAWGSADLAILCSPIALHSAQAVACLRGGMDVLLEKPVAATIAEAQDILRAQGETGHKVSIGFQWCYDPVMLQLKALTDSGALGRLLRMRSLVLWPRPRAYYRRNAWAGKAYDSQGNPVFDSISANATAHYLFNMLWLAGPGYAGAQPERVEASLFRTNDIETFDTATVCVTLAGGVQALHIASHAAGRAYLQNPMFLYEYEGACVTFGAYGQPARDITIAHSDGRQEVLGRSNPDTGEKLVRILRELGQDTRTVCPVEAACKHVAVMEALRNQHIPVQTFGNVQLDDDLLWVPGLSERLVDCYERFALLEAF